MQSEVLDASDEPTVSWLEPLPMAYKLKRGRIALGIAVALAAGGGFLQWHNGKFGQTGSLWLIVILAFGVWRYRA
jgi:hypothetical protein